MDGYGVCIWVYHIMTVASIGSCTIEQYQNPFLTCSKKILSQMMMMMMVMVMMMVMMMMMIIDQLGSA